MKENIYFLYSTMRAGNQRNGSWCEEGGGTPGGTAGRGTPGGTAGRGTDEEGTAGRGTDVEGTSGEESSC